MNCYPTRSKYKDQKCLTKEEMKQLEQSSLDIDSLDCLFQNQKLPKKWQTYLERHVYRPPVSETQWLSETDILLVMKNRELEIPKLKFLGVYPSNALVLFPSLIKSFQQVIERHRKKCRKGFVAMILNTDKLGLPGKHWVAVLYDMGASVVELFDSSGSPPSDLVYKSIKRIFPHVDFAWNSKRLQSGEYECGVFCMTFVLERANGRFKSLKAFTDNNYTDTDMARKRKEYFAEIIPCGILK